MIRWRLTRSRGRSEANAATEARVRWQLPDDEDNPELMNDWDDNKRTYRSGPDPHTGAMRAGRMSEQDAARRRHRRRAAGPAALTPPTLEMRQDRRRLREKIGRDAKPGGQRPDYGDGLAIDVSDPARLTPRPRLCSRCYGQPMADVSRHGRCLTR
jgi:hypothetical protein